MYNQIIRQAANAAPFQRIHLAIAASAMIFVISVESNLDGREAGERVKTPHPPTSPQKPQNKKKTLTPPTYHPVHRVPAIPGYFSCF